MTNPPYRSYREYLKHPKFLEVRAQVFERAAGRCERCHEWPPTEPHHLHYPPWGTFDVPENMIAVCHPCHCEIHGKKFP
ncbi:HNH endonuclease [Streptosporangium sandarakinum]